MGRRVLNRKDLRADYDAAERRKQEDEETEETDEAEEDDAEEGDEEEEVEAEADEEEGDGDAEGDDEEAPPKKRKPAKAKAPKAPKAAKPRTRTRTPKITRMKVVWGVFNNSNQRVAVFDYPKRKDADDLAAKLTGDKKNTHFVQPVKEPIEEKKDE
jgi:cobalamin biosynthesis protein CobT